MADLGVPTSLEAHAQSLADGDAELLYSLVEARRRSGLTVAVVAERIGWPEKQVESFEAYWADPKLSEIRRYALATGVLVTHAVEPAK